MFTEMSSAVRRPALMLLAAAWISLMLLAGGCASGGDGSAGHVSEPAYDIDLSKVNDYLVGKATALQQDVSELQRIADEYYGLAEAADFNYTALWENNRATVGKLLTDAKARFLLANSSYETMEGIVAGVEELAHYDVDIDAGNPASDGPDDVVSFDVPLPNGEVLEKPGNYFYLEELALWGTNPDWTADVVQPDLDGNGAVDFGEVLPDANVFKGVTDSFKSMSDSLSADAQAWSATPEDALTALVVMVPTMEEYFQAWKESRFVSGDNAESPQFVAVSRLHDIADILSGLIVVYGEVKPLLEEEDSALAGQTGRELTELSDFVLDLVGQEKSGTTFTGEQADSFGADAQNRATAIAGQVTQMAAKLGIEISA